MTPTDAHLLQPREYPKRLTIVIPLYNEAEVLPALREELRSFRRELRCPLEVILVNDGSCDSTLLQLVNWANDDPAVVVLDLSRNFGHQAAATAGLGHATGDAVVLMDADLQDPLGVVHRMLDRYVEGYDVVYGQRIARQGETWVKRATAWLFYVLMRRLVYAKLPADSGDFRLLSGKALSALLSMKEQHRFLRGMSSWIGFAQVAEPYDRPPRAAGSTKYSFPKMLTLAWTAATSFSTLPLRVSFLLGVLAGCLGIEEAIRALVARFMGQTVPGWTSLMVVGCALGSSLLFSVGILGEYVGKIYEEVKQRPVYIVARTFSQRSETDWSSDVARPERHLDSRLA